MYMWADPICKVLLNLIVTCTINPQGWSGLVCLISDILRQHQPVLIGALAAAGMRALANLVKSWSCRQKFSNTAA